MVAHASLCAGAATHVHSFNLLLSLAEVLLGSLWAWLFLGETASFYTLAGGAVLLSAITGNALSGKRRKPPAITTP